MISGLFGSSDPLPIQRQALFVLTAPATIAIFFRVKFAIARNNLYPAYLSETKVNGQLRIYSVTRVG